MVAVGLSPRTAAKHTIRSRRATAERSYRTMEFKRRSATPDPNTPLFRGLKSTATIMASLREARNAKRFMSEADFVASVSDPDNPPSQWHAPWV